MKFSTTWCISPRENPPAGSDPPTIDSTAGQPRYEIFNKPPHLLKIRKFRIFLPICISLDTKALSNLCGICIFLTANELRGMFLLSCRDHDKTKQVIDIQ